MFKSKRKCRSCRGTRFKPDALNGNFYCRKCNMKYDKRVLIKKNV